jgi:hypothetical protein
MMQGGTQVLTAAQSQLLRLEVATVAVGAGYIPNIFAATTGDGSGDPSGKGSGSGGKGQDPTVQPGYPGGTGSQTGTTSKNANILRGNLNAANRPQPVKGMAAHHIVHSTHSYPAAQQSRAILAQHGVDINEAVNGVWVSVSQNSRYNSHNYMDSVLKELRAATSKSDVLDILQDIRMRIGGNAFP